MQLDSPTLKGSTVCLTALSPACLPEFTRAALSAPQIWQHIPYYVRTPAEVEALLTTALEQRAQGTRFPFVTRLCESGVLIGGTSLYRGNPAVPSVEIGSTWIVPQWQRSAVNSEAKLLQLTHCFDILGCQRVEFKTDVRNLRSRAALARIGAREEGILRANMRRSDGSLRDSVLFSIVASEWPAVRERLRMRLYARA